MSEIPLKITPACPRVTLFSQTLETQPQTPNTGATRCAAPSGSRRPSRASRLAHSDDRPPDSPLSFALLVAKSSAVDLAHICCAASRDVVYAVAICLLCAPGGVVRVVLEAPLAAPSGSRRPSRASLLAHRDDAGYYRGTSLIRNTL